MVDGSAGDAAHIPGLAAKSVPRRIRLKGADAPITVLSDALGIPHIRAQSKRDAFFAQGYLAARDRLFQMDLQHRIALGKMAESFGPAFVPVDRASRLFHFRGDLEAELAAIPDAVRRCVAGYVAGVNARLDELANDPSLLPGEYGLLGIAPLRWHLNELLMARGTGTAHADDEIRRAMLAAHGLIDWDHFADPLRPAHPLTPPEGLELTAISQDDLGDLGHAGFKPPFSAAMLAGIASASLLADHRDLGSNAWTIAGEHTASGHPILANDPHLAIGGFSPRHMVHMSAPGLDVIGAGYPGQPGIMQGHTDHYAFGRTNFHIDQSDLYILKTNPDNDEEYWYEGAWRRFDIYEEELAVKGEPPRRLTLRYAGGKPVIACQSEAQRAVAAATTTMLPGANMRFAIAAINLAKDWDSLDEAFALHVVPTNFHYADRDGNIGWRAIGYAPRRPHHDGLFPVPGDGRYEWDGLIPLADMPSLYNPAKGWIASANAYNISADYPFAERPLSYTWTDPYRHDRAHEALADVQKHSINDSWALMHDVRSLAAQAFVKLIPEAEALAVPEALSAAKMLRNWPGDITADSAEALLYECALTALSAAFREQIIPPAAQEFIPAVSLEAMLQALAEGDPRLGDDPAARRHELMNHALGKGWARAAELAGDDPARWRWGDYHQTTIRHPLADIPAIGALFPERSGAPSGGDGTTLMARGIDSGHGFDVRHGASFLFAADLGDWDASVYALLPGQSAEPDSPHYADFYALWAAGKAQPMRFSKEAVEASAVRHELIESYGAED